ncbi:hypothetical protein Tco_1376302, partial [Tanacetum coccineum]
IMADANINAPEAPVAADFPPTRSDEQILPRDKWVPVGKSNCFLDVERTQANPIFKIAVDILKNTNFFRAFTASSTIPSIYIQQFWDTIRFDKDKGYSCQLDEQRFYLTKATLRDALQLPSDNSNFTPPPNSNTIISFVNNLGYPNVVRTLSGVVTNDMYQPWRALATIINLCLTGKTSGFERPRAPVLQILWGVVNGANIDYAERIWEEFTQANTSSTLYLLTEESALGYLKFSFKNTKRVRFGMAIPDTLISEEIQTATYYFEYMAKVTKYQWYLAGEAVSDDYASAPKPAKGATTKSIRKPKLQSSKTTPVAKPAASKTLKSFASQPSKPTPVLAKPQQKKRKLVEDTTEAPSQAKRSKAGKVLKKRTLSSTPQPVDEFVHEGVPDKEPMHGDEEADTQRVIEESLKEAQGAHRGPLPLVVFREPDTGKIQPLPDVEGKGKENVGEEQAAQPQQNPLVSLNLRHYMRNWEVSPYMNAQGQEEGQGGTNPRDDGVSQTLSSHVVYARPNLDHMDLRIAEASSQPNIEQMDDEFTSTAYPKVQENLKLLTEGDVRLEKPASSAGTPSSMKNLDKEFSFTDQFLVEKSQEDEPEKTNTKAEVQSMVTVPIHQDTSSVPLMTTPLIDITDPQSDSTTVPTSMPTTTATNIADLVDANQALEERLDKQGNRIHQLETQDLSRLIRERTVEFIDSQKIDQKIKESMKEVVTASVQHAIRAPLRARFKDLPMSDIKEILLQRMLEENYDKGHEDHKMAFEALQKSIIRDESEQFDADKSEERTKKKSKQDSPKTPPGLPPPPPSSASGASGPTGTSDSTQDPPPPPLSSTTNRGDQSHSFAAPSSSKTDASTAYTAWTTTTSRLKPAASSVPEDVLMHEESDFEAQDMGSDDEDSGSRHIPKASAIASSYLPPPENSLLSQTDDIGVFIDWFCKKQGITKLAPEHLEDGGMSQASDQSSRGQTSQGDRIALSITKMKAAYYPGVELEQMVPDQIWIEAEACMIFLQLMIVLRRADNQEYTIAENDFKDLYPSDFEDLYLLNLQGHLNHLPLRDRKILSSVLNLTKPRWEATSLEFMHDYKILDSPRAVLFRDKYGICMYVMRFKKSQVLVTRPLQQIDEALDYRVKEFKVNKKQSEVNTAQENLPELGKLCWWKNTRRRLRLATAETNDDFLFSHGAKGKDSFVKCDMTGNDDFVGVQVKASISMMIVRVPKKDRWCGTRGKFVQWKGVRNFADAFVKDIATCYRPEVKDLLEEHSGSKLGDPFPNIFLESGKSLMQCQIDAWEKLGELEKTDFYTVDVDGDDTCGLCGEGGNLICCDGCPSTLSPKQLRYRDHESCRPELDYQKLHCLGPILHDNSFLILADEGEYPLIEPLLLYGHGRDGTGGRSSGLIGGTLHLTDYANVTL